MKDWRTVLRLISILPIFVALVWAIGQYSGLEAYHASHAVVLGFVYFYNFYTLRKSTGLGARIFRFSLLVLAAAFFEHAIILLYLFNRGGAPAWAVYLHHETYYDFALHCVMAFAAMAMWSESQIDRLRDLTGELDHLRRERKHTMDLDRLTGLLNQAALAHRVEEPAGFEGVVVVCDMDNFKDINDRYGHLVGDEILRNIGNLLQSSIRHEDEAFRWGGDEFVILFRNQRTDVAVRRMADIESRLRDFRVRGLGILPITLQLGDGRYRRPRRCARRWMKPIGICTSSSGPAPRRALRANALRHGERWQERVQGDPRWTQGSAPTMAVTARRTRRGIRWTPADCPRSC